MQWCQIVEIGVNVSSCVFSVNVEKNRVAMIMCSETADATAGSEGQGEKRLQD